MKKRKKKAILIVSLIIAFILGVFICNRILLKKEAVLRQPMGAVVPVNGYNISVYTEGYGPKTFVFMSGGGTCSPLLDFKSLFSQLSNEYRVVVVERLGYGFSDDADVERDVDTMLNDTRSALMAAGISGPFILCPHSMSCIEALYWAQEYPKEVEAIIGLDMATPYHYEDLSIKMSSLRFTRLFFISGFARLCPNLWKSAAVKNGILSQYEKDVYRAVFYKRSASRLMLKEAKCIKNNADFVMGRGLPQIPLLMFVSNGEGTGMNGDLWYENSAKFVDMVDNGSIIKLDCPHYIHDYLYEDIGREIKIFVEAL